MGDAQLLGEWARLLFSTLTSAGVTDIWVSPGSRSTPFTWVAQQTPGLTLRAVVDERSAAFLALGHARITGRPCALLCTSGTAAANYFPAVVEAAQAHLPLIVLSADRPLEVQQASAAQTIDQVKLFGAHVRSFFDLGLPDAAPSALLGLRRTIAQAVAQSLGPLPGPVHLNLRARKPLEPAPPQNETEHALAARVTELTQKPLARHASTQILANEAVRAAARALAQVGSTAIVVGPLSASKPALAELIAELAELTASPIFAEASSQVRFALADHVMSSPLFDWLLSTPSVAEKLRPELVLCIGQTPTSSAYERWAARVPRRLVLAEYDYPDALGNAELVASGDLEQGLRALITELKRLSILAEGSRFLADLREAQALCKRRVAEVLDEPSAELSEAVAVKCVVDSLPHGAVLALGNSLPIRDVDAYVTRARRLRVVSQRGANGIDGLVSGAIGSAIASGAPTLLLIGDVSLLHDLGALASARLVKTPLVLAVIDNAGGRIFDQLPVQALYAADAEAAKLWLTPPPRELSHAAALFGLRYVAPTTPLTIGEAATAALARNEVTLLHLRVAPDSAAQLRRRVIAALAADFAVRRG
ncbi:MAG TPA: 2-succinyl-5-enolpyruvyl-6-hydroxy-3-cyclohexene-1-carboxylic-acid synthase [Polyangiaceae bacterium]|nr:2-succinyl-5-enolpyruvyl-6-hydroxy-3-cyclohexene-1-carboxylic-acid synthase [Polyangiaceae bacterium]